MFEMGQVQVAARRFEDDIVGNRDLFDQGTFDRGRKTVSSWMVRIGTAATDYRDYRRRHSMIKIAVGA